ncbi:MAG: DUF2779 domain-containing protein [Chloroflexi bacterium]|nr:DUF2779 domain-containing protein [Chloroflexota bacterium]
MTTHDPLPLLSKSRFTAGLQCLKRLYLQCYEPTLATPPDDGQQALFDTGTEIGRLAQGLHPHGVLVAEDYRHHKEAVARTAALMADPDVPAIFEAAFTEDGIRIRVDLLVRDGEGWALVEVKGSTSVKEQYIDDVAVQLWALAYAGLDIRRAAVAHIDNTYVYPGGEYDPQALFTVADVTAEAQARLATVPDDVARMRLALQQQGAPQIDIGAHCRKPYNCEFMAHCYQGEPENPISDLPNIRSTRVQSLREQGIRSIHDLPTSERLSDIQQRVRASVLSGEPYADVALPDALEALRPPVHFIDFETTAPALPIYPGTRPFETLAFQWSDHVLHPDGQIEHSEFLADGEHDPREPFAISLIEQLQGAETIAVYSSYEWTQLRALAGSLPHLRTDIERILESHVVDLHPVVRNHYYHPSFHGSFSLKSVLPTLVPEMGYDELEIREGGAASRAFVEMRNPNVPPDERMKIREALLTYCAQDTLAMVRIVEALRNAVNGS